MRIRSLATAITAGLILSSIAPLSFAGEMVGAGDGAAAGVPMTVTGSYTVELNKTQILYLPESASAVVVGNPDIADISVHSNDTIFLVGKGFGETNIIVLNKNGHTILNADVQVAGSGSTNNVRVYAGSTLMRSTYNCAPMCQPAPVLGDDTAFVGNNSTKTKAISNTFAPGSAASMSQVIGMAREQSADNAAAPAPSAARN